MATVAALACGKRLGEQLARTGISVELWYASGPRRDIPVGTSPSRADVLVVDNDVPGAAVLRWLATATAPVPVLQIVRPGAAWRPANATLARPFSRAALTLAVGRLLPAAAPRRQTTAIGRAAAVGLALAATLPTTDAGASVGQAVVAPKATAVLASNALAPSTVRTGTMHAGIVNAGGHRLALRVDASTRHAPIAWMRDGASLRVLGVTAGEAVLSGDSRWMRVQYGGTIGYAYSAYVTPAPFVLADGATKLG